ncbi:MAG: hypothetical protein PHG05_01515 [Candidatus Nanoarchaeia archaeon]|nr:hypothetical protein [Candidatus Nanoarchaeia archaeon]
MRYRFGTSGIRGEYPSFINEELLFKLGQVISERFSKVYVGMDSRKSSEFLLQSLIQGLLINDLEVFNFGLAPVGAAALISKKGLTIYITASHNPFSHNGFKIFYDGGEIYGNLEKTIEKELNIPKSISYEERGIVKEINLEPEYVKKLLFLEKGSSKVLLIPNGSSKIILPWILNNLGHRVKVINESYPIEEYDRRKIKRMILENKSHIGILLDCDGDRAVIFDENGDEVQKDVQLNIAIDYLKPNSLVLTVESAKSSSSIIKNTIITKVGSKYVGKVLKETKAEFGGEPAGEFIYPSLSLCPDGIATALLFLKILKKEKISALKNKFKIPAISREKYKVKDKEFIMKKIEKELKKEYKNLNLEDGIRIDSSDGFVLIRPSGTESLIRLTYENFKEINKIKDIISKNI